MGNTACTGEEPLTVHDIYKEGGAELAWFRKPAAGDDSKETDCFYCHPTTAMGMMSWNIAYDNYSTGDELTGMAAGTPDLWETQVTSDSL